MPDGWAAVPAPGSDRVRRACVRAGFTLLEVILALALGLFLLAAVYTALKLHLTTARWGPEQVQQAQLARALLDRLSRDLQAVVLPGSEQAGTDSASESQTASEGEAASEQEQEDAYLGCHGGLWGGSDWLEMIVAVHRPNVDQTEAAALSDLVPSAATMRRVTYTAVPVSSTAGQTGQALRMGLTRTELAVPFASLLTAGSDDVNYRAATDLLTDSLSYVQFQYWDDGSASWLDSWGTDGPTAPPRAVKVIIRVLSPEQQAANQQATTQTASAWEPFYQKVIPVPVYDAEMAQAAAEQAEQTSYTGSAL